MDGPREPSQMEVARAYVGAFIVGGLTAALLVGAILMALVPRDQGLIVIATLAAGAAGGLTAASISPLRNGIARVINFVQGW